MINHNQLWRRRAAKSVVSPKGSAGDGSPIIDKSNGGGTSKIDFGKMFNMGEDGSTTETPKTIGSLAGFGTSEKTAGVWDTIFAGLRNLGNAAVKSKTAKSVGSIALPLAGMGAGGYAAHEAGAGTLGTVGGALSGGMLAYPASYKSLWGKAIADLRNSKAQQAMANLGEKLPHGLYPELARAEMLRARGLRVKGMPLGLGEQVNASVMPLLKLKGGAVGLAALGLGGDIITRGSSISKNMDKATDGLAKITGNYADASSFAPAIAGNLKVTTDSGQELAQNLPGAVKSLSWGVPAALGLGTAGLAAYLFKDKLMGAPSKPAPRATGGGGAGTGTGAAKRRKVTIDPGDYGIHINNIKVDEAPEPESTVEKVAAFHRKHNHI